MIMGWWQMAQVPISLGPTSPAYGAAAAMASAAAWALQRGPWVVQITPPHRSRSPLFDRCRPTPGVDLESPLGSITRLLDGAQHR